MFGIGFFELLVIAVVALVFVGPKKLPDFMKTAGRFFVQMRRTANDVRSTFDQVIHDAENEIRREEAETMKALLAKNATPVAQLEARSDDGHHPDGTLVTPETPEAPVDPFAEPHGHGYNDAAEQTDTPPDTATDTPPGAKPFQPGVATPPKPASES